MQTLNLLPIGEFPIAKWTKYGVWIESAGTKIFIHFSDTFSDPRKWNEEESKPGIMSGLSATNQTYADSERKEAAPAIGTTLQAVKVEWAEECRQSRQNPILPNIHCQTQSILVNYNQK